MNIRRVSPALETAILSSPFNLLPRPPRPLPPRVRDILCQVAEEHGCTVDDLRGPRHFRAIAYARFDAMTRLRSMRKGDGSHQFSLPQIGSFMGGRDHTTVLNGLRRWSLMNPPEDTAATA